VTKRSLIVVVFIAALANVGLQSQKAPSIQGVWRVVERTSPVDAPFRAKGIQKDPQPGFHMFTGKHYSQVIVNADKPRPELPQDVEKATADQLRAAWQPFVSNAGTYELKGNVLTMHQVVAKDPTGMKQPNATTWTYKVEGKTLTMTQKTNQAGPIANPVTLKFTRVE
jgi:hypothetical protein